MTPIDIENYLSSIIAGNERALARVISLVENEVEGYEDLLAALPDNNHSAIIGITGAPGAGKSTLTDALTAAWVANNEKIAIFCIDPSSPFHHGALLGDRIRMNTWTGHPRVYIRSLANKGSLGGLHPKITEITSLAKAAGYHKIIVETVGVGQSEIEIAGLADTVVVVFVPESGDDVQNMKAGLMEVGNIFVVNKADRPGADLFVKNLRAVTALSHHAPQQQPLPIIKTVASEAKGIDELAKAIAMHHTAPDAYHKLLLTTERTFQLIRDKRMKDIDKKQLQAAIAAEIEKKRFNMYRFAAAYMNH